MEAQSTQRMTGRSAFDSRVMAALAKVPRHEFVPKERVYEAYNNGPLPIGHGQTISQPYIVALMTDLLEPKPEDVILEVGTGSGYQAAILSPLVSRIYTLEVVDQLSKQASAKWQELGYDNIVSRSADGYYGWEEHAPFDGILVTAAAPDIPSPLIEQLKPGGKLVIPVGFPHSHQELMLVEKDSTGKTNIRKILDVAFVPLIGGHEASADLK